MNLRFDEKVAIVTGGATGIGAATAATLCELGATVAIFDRNVEGGQSHVASLIASGGKASFHVCDVASESNMKQAVEAVVQQHGRLDVLVSNAGIQTYGDAAQTSSELWDKTFAVHVKGCFYATHYSIPHMIEFGGGAIVIVSSVLSSTAVTNSAAYVAAKHAQVGLARSIALDFAKKNIRANAICPGSIDTPMLRWSADQTGAPEKMLATLGRMHAVGRIGRAEEVAKAIAFLASDWASFITGTTLVVDGGLILPTGGMGFQESGIGTEKA